MNICISRHLSCSVPSSSAHLEPTRTKKAVPSNPLHLGNDIRPIARLVPDVLFVGAITFIGRNENFDGKVFVKRCRFVRSNTGDNRFDFTSTFCSSRVPRPFTQSFKQKHRVWFRSLQHMRNLPVTETCLVNINVEEAEVRFALGSHIHGDLIALRKCKVLIHLLINQVDSWFMGQVDVPIVADTLSRTIVNSHRNHLRYRVAVYILGGEDSALWAFVPTFVHRSWVDISQSDLTVVPRSGINIVNGQYI
mmetsp:Transcript_47991/g.71487  ORF Transcript_47991/g.71487 Transcript_47991/m.71487 type:complete len:250 (+) Transcript_47991:84-833(+)